METNDKQFFDTFMLVLAILVVFTVAVYVLAGAIASATQHEWTAAEPAASKLAQARIKPVATVAVAGDEASMAVAEPAPPPQPAVKVAMTGEAVYNSGCNVCHAAGVAGAPKLGDVANWQPRIAQGVDVLRQHAINGYTGSAGVMPAKGGFVNLSDEEVHAAIDYMVQSVQ